MPSRTVKYWLKTDFEKFEPFATSRKELRMLLVEGEKEWCQSCIAVVEPVGDQCGFLVCPFCDADTSHIY